MHFNKLIVESDDKVKTVWKWKIVKQATLKQSTDIEIPPIKINDNIVNDSKHIANSFNTYFLTIVERMNSSDTITPTEDAMKLLAKAIPNLFLNMNLMPTTLDEIKNIIISLK
jgi:capsular polysaccharide biosynthesis protein